VRFRAVFFDAGETLVHPSPSFPGLFLAVLAEHGHERDLVDVTAAARTVGRRFSEAARDQDRWTLTPERSRRFWMGVYEQMLGSLDLPARDGLREDLYRAFTDLGNYAVFDDVREVLDGLTASGIILGIVSNFESWLGDLLLALDVRDRFRVIVISGVEGIEKPDPAIYRLALERADVPATQSAFVGDSPIFDIEPARALGLTPVLIDRRGLHPGHAGHRIEDLRELPGLLGTS
jgi:putative hydrolase of the HAD superfamily